jgi:hypothetical protein
MLANGCGSLDISFPPTHQPTNQPTNKKARANSSHFHRSVHSCARNALLGCEKEIWNCNKDCAYADEYPILVRSGRHCFMQLTASVVVLEQCTTSEIPSPFRAPHNCDHLQLILKEASSGRTLYAPQAHTPVTAAHCMHLRYTHRSLQHTV